MGWVEWVLLTVLTVTLPVNSLLEMNNGLCKLHAGLGVELYSCSLMLDDLGETIWGNTLIFTGYIPGSFGRWQLLALFPPHSQAWSQRLHVACWALQRTSWPFLNWWRVASEIALGPGEICVLAALLWSCVCGRKVSKPYGAPSPVNEGWGA